MDIESIARSYTPACMKALGGWATEDDDKIDKDLKFRAIALLMDRGWGRPKQQHSADISGSIEILLRDIAAEKAKKK